MDKPIYVSVTDSEGVVIDRFPVYHWTNKHNDTVDSYEFYGSLASEVVLKQRVVDAIRRGYGE